MEKKSDKFKIIIPIIILNWNGEKDTIACLESIKNSDNEVFLPIVVDNGSGQESIDNLKEACSKLYNEVIYLNEDQIDDYEELIKETIDQNSIEDVIIYIQNFQNYGFAKGNNIGVKIANLIDSEWVMLLNNDTEIVHNSLSILNDFINKNKDFVAVTPQIRLYNPKNKIWNCGGKLTYFGSRKYFYSDKNIDKVPQIGHSLITFVTGCALLFQYKKTGVLTEDFFFGEEDYEFSLRMQEKNFKMACVYESIIYHKVGSTIKKNSNAINSIYLYYINRFINSRNYYSKIRWKTTKLLAFVYLPVLLIMNKIDPFKSISLGRKINTFVKKNDKVDVVEFKRVLDNKL